VQAWQSAGARNLCPASPRLVLQLTIIMINNVIMHLPGQPTFAAASALPANGNDCTQPLTAATSASSPPAVTAATAAATPAPAAASSPQAGSASCCRPVGCRRHSEAATEGGQRVREGTAPAVSRPEPAKHSTHSVTGSWPGHPLQASMMSGQPAADATYVNLSGPTIPCQGFTKGGGGKQV